MLKSRTLQASRFRGCRRFLVSPADCLDFLLGELFQDRWRQHQMQNVRIRSFSKYQQSRFRALLEEHLAWLNQIGDSSAWTSLKDQRPPTICFALPDEAT
jgi:hypothetical protein